MYLSAGANSGTSSFIETFFLGGAVGGAGGGAAAAVVAAGVGLAEAEKQSNVRFLPHVRACAMLASVLWRPTSICWYWFAVSGDVLTNLLALQHRVHHHSSNNCKVGKVHQKTN